MKKIMFNDKYGLTRAVLEGHKTMTRRIEKGLENLENGVFCFHGKGEIHLYGEGGTIIEKIKTHYQLGEIIAIAQSYDSDDVCEYQRQLLNVKENSKEEGYIIGYLMSSKGWNNKMFVKAELMPHHIRTNGIKVERLQDISDEDCLREGLEHCPIHGRNQQAYFFYDERKGNEEQCVSTNPKETFAHLIDRVSGKGTWERNPFVVAYEFERID